MRSPKKSDLPEKNLRFLRSTVLLAEKMGRRLGGRQMLFRTLPAKSSA
jgi:hypothetical protein